MRQVTVMTLIGAVLLCAVAATDGYAGEAETKAADLVDSRLLHGVFAADPKGVWRIMTQTDETSTSTCIGDPVTPLCAIESVQACFARVIGELCTIAYGPYLGEPVVFTLTGAKWTEGHWRMYRVDSVRLATDHDLWDDYKGIDARHVGDLLVGVEVQSCRDKPVRSGCDDSPAPTIYTVRKASDRWAVVHVFQIHYR